MRFLVVGSGGREHALCRALQRSPRCGRIFVAPGNAGIAREAELVPIAVDDIDGLTDFAVTNAIDLVVIGPEVPLVLGLADRLAEKGIKAFGPSEAAARLEGSKGFMKDKLAAFGVPTAAYGRFTDAEAAAAYIRKMGAPIVVKTDGLAAGKGVVVAQTVEEALAAVSSMMNDRAFGEAGAELVVEEFLSGEEASFFALVDGHDALALGSAQDHKRVGDGDTGPNTGGMGAYAPAPVVTPDIERKIMERCILPTVRGLEAEGTPYKGVLFAGVMIENGEPRLLEYNVRFGDPECQVLMARLKSDLVDLMLATIDGTLAGQQVEWDTDPALVVVIAAKGYPGPYVKGSVIHGLGDADAEDGVSVLHAGTDRDGQGQVIATGGRVLNVTAHAPSLAEAREKAYRAVDRIDWPEGFCRRDIAWRALGR